MRCCFAVLLLTAMPVPIRADEDAAVLYDKAAAMLDVMTPSSKDMEWDSFRPPPKKWRDVCAKAWKENQPAYALIRKARSLKHGSWPAKDEEVLNRRLNRLRLIACSVGDVAHYRHLEHDDVEAIELIRDVLHLATVLRENPPKDFPVSDRGIRPMLVSVGIDAFALFKLNEIVADIALTKDPAADKRALSVADARMLIRTLLDRPQEPNDLLRATLGEAKFVEAYGKAGPRKNTPLVEQLYRWKMELSLSAMSLACHVYRFDHNRWPATLDELVAPAYLPHAPPIDPWGDGKQTFGYALEKAALPDGADRPLVYGRCESKGSLLMYRADGPSYDFYVEDGSSRDQTKQIKAGQFRDVARWSPKDRLLEPDDRPHLRSLQADGAPGL